MSISLANISLWQSTFVSLPINLMVQNIVTQNPLQDVFIDRATYQTTEHIFSHQVDPRSKITNQKSSGRCWLFAALNTMRIEMMKKHDLKEFEFSQSYLFFYDKLERSNYVLEAIIDAKKNNYKVDSQMIQHLLSDPLGDGGQWDMVANLINKYGIVPKSVYPESRHSSYSREMNSILTRKIREYAKDLMETNENVQNLKNKMIGEMYQMLCKFLGTPPSVFNWEYSNKNGYKIIKDLTPINFYQNIVPFNVDEYYSLINDPRNEYNKLYSIQYLGNVVEGYKVRYLNVAIDRMKELSKNMILDNEPVWFGCDVGKENLKSSCLMDKNILAYEEPLGVKFNLTKKEKLIYKESLMTHAMVLSGCNIIEDNNSVCNKVSQKVNRWEVENSWGDRGPAKGYCMITDKWFDEYVYEVLINKKYLNKEELYVIEQEEFQVLPPWDPLGALAKN
ncbi:Peptidase C1-like family [seawater metagenome]|uniref:Peptidase C1-like family n=1 Tax=seawater metagenome TaxID=1561972 RepID=A0A5E8CKX5_9ZZZZ